MPAMNSPLPEIAADNSTYEGIARHIVASDIPSWLVRFLRHSAPTIYMDRETQLQQPTKAAMRGRLVEIGGAAALLRNALSDVAIREFLEHEAAIRIENLGGLEKTLRVIAERAEIAANSPAISNEDGEAKAGRGRALPSVAIQPKTYCALVISETWKFVHGVYPRLRSQEAAAAAHALWHASGARETGWGNEPLNAWRYHFATALILTEAAESVELRRRLTESARH